MKILLYSAAAILFVVHQDFWLWDDSRLVGGVFPVGLFYHVLYCLLASVLFYLLIRFAWPTRLEAEASLPGQKEDRPWR